MSPPHLRGTQLQSALSHWGFAACSCRLAAGLSFRGRVRSRCALGRGHLVVGLQLEEWPLFGQSILMVEVRNSRRASLLKASPQKWEGFRGGALAKNLPANVGSTPGSGRSPGGGNGNPLQYSCLENPMDRGDKQATVHGVKKSQTWLSTTQQLRTETSLLLPSFHCPGWSHSQAPLGREIYSHAGKWVDRQVKYLLNKNVIDYIGRVNKPRLALASYWMQLNFTRLTMVLQWEQRGVQESGSQPLDNFCHSFIFMW